MPRIPPLIAGHKASRFHQTLEIELTSILLQSGVEQVPRMPCKMAIKKKLGKICSTEVAKVPHCVARSQKCTRARSEDILCHRMHSSTRHNTPNAGKNTVSTSAMFKHCNAEPRVEDCLFLLSLQHTTWPSKPQPCHVLLPCLLCPCQWAEHWF